MVDGAAGSARAVKLPPCGTYIWGIRTFASLSVVFGHVEGMHGRCQCVWDLSVGGVWDTGFGWPVKSGASVF